MIVSRGRGYIFVHIPKTGGTSLMLALEARAMKDDILIGDTPKARRRRRRLEGARSAGRLWKHSTLADIDGLVTGPELAEMFVFTLVRNPWDRMVSYYHWLRAQSFAHPAVGMARSLDFSGFLNHPATRAALARNPYASHVAARDGTERCDLFIRLESLDEGLEALRSRLDLRLPAPGHVNRSNRAADWRGYYSGDDAELVGRICREDCLRFAYRFDDADRLSGRGEG